MKQDESTQDSTLYPHIFWTPVKWCTLQTKDECYL
jgi:hypothetical protein